VDSGFEIDGVVHGEGAVDDAVFDLAALAHEGEGSGVEGGLHGGIDGFDRGQDGDFGLFDTEGASNGDGVGNDVGFLLEVGGYVDAAIGDEQELVVAVDFIKADVAEQPVGPQSFVAFEDGLE